MHSRYQIRNLKQMKILLAAGITAVVGWIAYRTTQLSQAKSKEKHEDPINKQAD